LPVGKGNQLREGTLTGRRHERCRARTRLKRKAWETMQPEEKQPRTTVHASCPSSPQEGGEETGQKPGKGVTVIVKYFLSHLNKNRELESVTNRALGEKKLWGQ